MAQTGQTRDQRAGLGYLSRVGNIVFPVTSAWMSRLCIATDIRGVTMLTISAFTSRLTEKYSELE